MAKIVKLELDNHNFMTMLRRYKGYRFIFYMYTKMLINIGRFSHKFKIERIGHIDIYHRNSSISLTEIMKTKKNKRNGNEKREI
jgi:hypothetical protein